ncbi:MAG TPA: acetolactate synthase [Phycisphaerae bacterium]|nr:acetolactate synthase [Phycisphaerae bacterium]
MPTQYGFEPAETFRSPTVRQISVFLDDRVGALLRLFQAFEGSDVRVVGMSVVHAIDCAIVRLICDNNEEAIKRLKEKSFPFTETELVVVEVPHGHGLRSICSALLAGEVNIDYAYPLLTRPTGRAALAIHTDEIETAIKLLQGRQFAVMTEDDLGDGPRR